LISQSFERQNVCNWFVPSSFRVWLSQKAATYLKWQMSLFLFKILCVSWVQIHTFLLASLWAFWNPYSVSDNIQKEIKLNLDVAQQKVWLVLFWSWTYLWNGVGQHTLPRERIVGKLCAKYYNFCRFVIWEFIVPLSMWADTCVWSGQFKLWLGNNLLDWISWWFFSDLMANGKMLPPLVHNHFHVSYFLFAIHPVIRCYVAKDSSSIIK